MWIKYEQIWNKNETKMTQKRNNYETNMKQKVSQKNAKILNANLLNF